MKLLLTSLTLACIAAFTISCKGGQEPKEFLAWSMDQHKALKSYSAKAEWKVEGGVMNGDTAARTVSYQAPNMFQIVSARKGGLTSTTVSDGVKLLDYTNDKKRFGISYLPAASFSESRTMQMMLPMSCGSLLYTFFGGGEDIDKLVDKTKGDITDEGEEDLPGGGRGKLLKFYATGVYGNVKVLIDKETGMVARISYDSDALLQKVKESGMSDKEIGAFQTTEIYSDVKTNATLEASLFSAKPPPGVAVKTALEMGVFMGDPLPIGKPAPDFTVVGLDGKSVKLSSLRGKPVFLDFWATWCGPCRISLPHTQKIATDHGKEISVLAISNETAETISNFRKEGKFTFPAYRDVDSMVTMTYGAASIPTFVVIDSKGVVVDYLTGYGGEEAINAALAKVGITVVPDKGPAPKPSL